MSISQVNQSGKYCCCSVPYPGVVVVETHQDKLQGTCKTSSCYEMLFLSGFAYYMHSLPIKQNSRIGLCYTNICWNEFVFIDMYVHKKSCELCSLQIKLFTFQLANA